MFNLIYKKDNSMNIEINDNTTFKEIHDVFNNYYTYLQINFYRKRHKRDEVSKETDLINPECTISETKKTQISRPIA